MAEVPEVETIVRDLRAAVVGRVIARAEVVQPVTVRFPTAAEFAALLIGRTVQGAERRSKHILLPLDGELLLEMHFMLWGTLLLTQAGSQRPPETLIVYTLEGGDELHFKDTLGYARAALGTPAEVSARLGLAALGPDALDEAFTLDVLTRQLGKRRGVLKTVLITPRILSGLGNRDADESMWLAQIDPRRAPNTLTGDELARLYAAIGEILREGIGLRGTQRDLFGVPGGAKHRRYVFERTGQPCPRCGTRVAHLKIGGRNTHYCPNCQH